MDSCTVEKAVLAALDDYDQQAADAPPLGTSRDTALFGEGGALDSIGLVNLILCVEQRLADDLGLEVTIADEKAMSQKNSPFRTVGALVDYVDELIARQ